MLPAMTKPTLSAAWFAYNFGIAHNLHRHTYACTARSCDALDYRSLKKMQGCGTYSIVISQIYGAVTVY